MATVNGGYRTRGRPPASRPGQPLVSIVTVVYNGAETLERTIRSVLDQTWPNIEYIIVDGGSKDGTLDLIRRYEDRIAYWESGPDAGIFDAMNKGVALCTGEWVALINADDWYPPHAVERVMQEAERHPGANIFHGDIWLEFPNGKRSLKRPKVSGFLLRHWEMTLNHPSFFVRRSYYQGRPFDASLKVRADHQWAAMAYQEDPAQFVQIHEPLAHFSIGGASTSTSLGKVLAEGAQVSRSLGMGPWGMFLGHVVRSIMYPVQHLKLVFNQYVAPHFRGQA